MAWSRETKPRPRVSTFLARRSGFRTSNEQENQMRDTAEYNRCLVKGCAYMLRAPMTVCNYHAADLVVTDEHGDARRLVDLGG